jgi:PIN domain nuclease of toxin-antitoxin system
MGRLRLLLDTHGLLWALLEPHKLPEVCGSCWKIQAANCW